MSDQFSQKQVCDSLEEAYDLYPQIGEEFQAVLDTSLNPRGPEMLYDLVSDLGLPPSTVSDIWPVTAG
jgi:hypothetical protein